MVPSLRLVTPPAEEPVSLAEAKGFLKVETTEDDALIAGLIAAARRLVETRLRRALVAQTWDYALAGFPPARGFPGHLPGSERPYISATSAAAPIRLPLPALVSVTSITYLDPGLNAVVLDPTLYKVVAGSPGHVLPAYGKAWPTAIYHPDSVTVRFVAGYGNAAAVPDTVKVAMQLAIKHLYDDRGEGEMALPPVCDLILQPEEWGFYA